MSLSSPEELAQGSAREPKDGSLTALSSGELFELANQFQIEPVLQADEFLERGNINFHTYGIHCAEGKEYLLQCINSEVFKKPHRIMQAMVAWIEAQRSALAVKRHPAASIWEPITLVKSQGGNEWIESEIKGKVSVWRLMELIPNVRTYKSLDSAGSHLKEKLSVEMGRGLALTADFAGGVNLQGLVTSLPGYRDTKGYYAQLHSVLELNQSPEEAASYLPSDTEVRESTESLYYLSISKEEAKRRREDPELAPFIEMALKWESRAKSLQEGVAAGVLPRTAIHGDTKLENFLFDRDTHQVKSLVDLDTIMPYTWLADWGDMIRSLVNVAGEKEENLSRVQVDKDVYRWAAEGFMTTTQNASPAEVDMMAHAVQAIALELGSRFLADYLRGDNYFALAPGDPPQLNKTRAMVQLTLFERLLEAEDWCQGVIKV